MTSTQSRLLPPFLVFSGLFRYLPPFELLAERPVLPAKGGRPFHARSLSIVRGLGLDCYAEPQPLKVLSDGRLTAGELCGAEIPFRGPIKAVSDADNRLGGVASALVFEEVTLRGSEPVGPEELPWPKPIEFIDRAENPVSCDIGHTS